MIVYNYNSSYHKTLVSSRPSRVKRCSTNTSWRQRGSQPHFTGLFLLIAKWYSDKIQFITLVLSLLSAIITLHLNYLSTNNNTTIVRTGRSKDLYKPGAGFLPSIIILDNFKISGIMYKLINIMYKVCESHVLAPY